MGSCDFPWMRQYPYYLDMEDPEDYDDPDRRTGTIRWDIIPSSTRHKQNPLSQHFDS